MTKAIAHTYDFAFQYRMHISYALIASCMLMILIYAVNVYSMISRTVAMQKIETQAAVLDTKVAALDTQYLGLSSAITPDSLSAYGLDQGQVSEFITRATRPVAMSGHEF